MAYETDRQHPLRIEVLPLDALEQDAAWWAIYEASFPPDERESREIILRSLEQGVGLATRAVSGGTTIGITTGHLLLGVPSVFCPYIAMAPEARGQGLGGPLLEHLYREGGARLEARGLSATGLSWEVESLEAAPAAALELRRKRVAFFERQGGHLLPCPYLQPPVDGSTLVPMHLMFKPAPGGSLPGPEEQRALTRAIYLEKYGGPNQLPHAFLGEVFRRLYPDAAW